MDAIRIEDGKQMVMKQVHPADAPEELVIGRLFSNDPQASDAHNHCLRICDVLNVPDEEGVVLMVMPLLSDWRTPEFETVGEFVSFVQQIFEVCSIRFCRSNTY